MSDDRRSPHFGQTIPLPGFLPEEESDEMDSDVDGQSAEDERPAEIEIPAEGGTDSALREESFEKLQAEALRWSSEKTIRILESLLFVAEKPLSEDVIRKNTGLDLHAIREAMSCLQAFYDESCRGIVLAQVAGGWQLRTNAESAPVIRRFLKVKPLRLTRAALETLAVVAYRQPVTRAEIEDIRAVDCGAVLKALLERRLIKIVGKREEPGRPLIYGTTREFLEFFGLRDLSGLPTLREFQELSKESEEVVERELGPDSKKGVQSIVQDLRDRSFEEKLKAGTIEADAALADLESALAASDEAVRQADDLLAEPKEGAEISGEEDQRGQAKSITSPTSFE